MKKPENWDKNDSFVFLSQEKTLLEALKTNGYVVPGIPEIYVLSGASPFLKSFRKQYHMD